MKRPSCLAAALAALLLPAPAALLLPAPAAALFHLAVIQELQASLGGDAGVQFVEIRMESGSQTFVANTVLGVFDEGGSLVDDYVVPGNLANGGGGVTWLMASPGFQAAAGIAPDFVLDVSLPAAGGMVCWGAPGSSAPDPASWDHGVAANYTDCVAYGTYSGPSNVYVGAPTPLDAAGHALVRVAETHDSANDFACANPATPRNNDGEQAALAATTPCPACGDGLVDAGETCDDGNTVDCDGCDSTCLVVACGDAVTAPACEECDDGNTASGDGCDAACTLECGNGVLDPGEDCDDGNRLCGDACDATCTFAACGDAVLQCGEGCDDGNTVSGDGCEPDCTLVCAPLSRDEQRCIAELNKRFGGVWKAASKLAASCLKGIARGKQAGELDACLLADGRGKVARAEAKTQRGEAKRCTGVAPPLAARDAAAVNAAAGGAALGVVEDVFGDAPVADAKAQKEAARCQLEAARALSKAGAAAASAFLQQKRAALAADVCNTSALVALLESSLRSEKALRVATRAATKLARKCPSGDLSAWFAAGLDAGSSAALADAALERMRCRLCEALEEADALPLDCDVADDGETDGSC